MGFVLILGKSHRKNLILKIIPTTTISIMIFLLTIACTDEITPIRWAGYMYQQTLEEDDGMVLLETGELTLLDTQGNHIADATNPIEGTPYYWQFELQSEYLEQEIAMRIQGEDTVPMLWRGVTPTSNASWLSGAIFTQEIAFTQTYFDNFSYEITDVDLTDTTVSHLWGQPLVPEDWIDATIQVFDGNGEEVPVYSFNQLSNGTITSDTSAGVIWFFAWNMIPGEIRLQVTTSDGGEITTIYPAEGGDVLSAVFYSLGDSQL
jgi:hypothetical protein